MIAPCGMNCGICMANLRDKNKCNGCRSNIGYKSESCAECIIRNCELLKNTVSKFCYECSKSPCPRLKQLDKRYRLKYKMSMIENLQNIEKFGLENFVENESLRWKCETCGGTICVHKGFCINCNDQKNNEIKMKDKSSAN